MQWNKLRSFLLIVLSLILMACVQTTSPSDANIEMALEMSPQPPVVGESELVITLKEANGEPITDATLEIVGDMNHAGMVPVVRDLTAADEDGAYRTPFEWTMGGDWFVTVVAFLADGTEVEQTFDMTVAMGEDGEGMDHGDMDHGDADAESEDGESMGHDHDDEGHAEDKSDEGMGHDHDDAESDESEGMSHDHDDEDHAEDKSDEGMDHDHDDEDHADEEKSEDGMSHDHDDDGHAEDKSDEDTGHNHGDHDHGDADAEEGESSDMDHSGEMDGTAMAKMIDTSALHEIDEAARAGNVEPESIPVLEDFVEALNSMALPAEYDGDVEAANNALADLKAAMETEDMEAAQPLIAEMHDMAHDLKIRLGEMDEDGHDDEHSHD